MPSLCVSLPGSVQATPLHAAVENEKQKRIKEKIKKIEQEDIKNNIKENNGIEPITSRKAYERSPTELIPRVFFFIYYMSSISNRLDGHDRDIYKINIQNAETTKEINARFDIEIMEDEENDKRVRKKKFPVKISFGTHSDVISKLKRISRR